MRKSLNSYCADVERAYDKFIESPSTALPALCEAIVRLRDYRAAERKREADKTQPTLF